MVLECLLLVGGPLALALVSTLILPWLGVLRFNVTL